MGTVGPDGARGANSFGRALQVFAEISASTYTLSLSFDVSGKPVTDEIAFVGRGGRLRVRRTGLPGAAICLEEDELCHAPLPWSGTKYYYIMSGTQKLLVERVPPPFRVNSSAEPRPGVPGIFSAEAEIPVLRDSYRWYFVRGDTGVAPKDPRNPFADGIEPVFACFRQPVCAYTPPGPGRMYASASPNGVYSVTAASPVVMNEQPTLALTCVDDQGRSSRVMRGAMLRCEASMSGSSDSVAIKWSFNGKGRRDGDVASRVWEGPVAQHGTVTVSASSAGRSLGAVSAEITVENRDWSGRRPMVTTEEVKPGDKGMPVLPEVPSFAEDLGRANTFPPRPAPEISMMIDTGPNAGLAYVGDLPLVIEARYIINTAALTAGSDFARLQQPDRGAGSGTRLGGKNYCDRSSIERVREAVRVHELKHIEVYTERLNELFEQKAIELEQMTSESFADLEDAYDAFISLANQDAAVTSERVVDDPRGPWLMKPVDGQGLCQLRNAAGGDLENKP